MFIIVNSSISRKIKNIKKIQILDSKNPVRNGGTERKRRLKQERAVVWVFSRIISVSI
jgi:hypothetical protein